MISTLYIASYDIKISFEFLVILVLLIYITYLHLQLSKKNFIIKTYIDKYHEGSNSSEKKDLISLLEDLKNPHYSGVVSKDKMLNKKFRQFLFEDDDKTKLFLHYTAKQDVAKKILEEGFIFVNSFYKTAVSIYNDELYLVHRHHEHKQYGHYVIVICISKDMYNHYSIELNKRHAKNIAVEQILTEHPIKKDDEGEELYILPQQFVKGYFNYMDGTMEENPEFDYNYHSDIFEKNLKKIPSK